MLHAVVPGRRYVIGKDESCDLRVDGTFTSRRHAEIWLEDDGWRVADAGSTNGVRVESAQTGLAARASVARSRAATRAVRLGEGTRIVLSARAEGPASDYPSITLRRLPRRRRASPVTPIASGNGRAEARR